MQRWQRNLVSVTGLLGVVLGAGGSIGVQPAGAVTQENFIARTTADYVAVCSTPESDSMYLAAMAFCQGYGVGAYHYYETVVEAQGKKPFVCLPNPKPPRHEILQGFVAWTARHPEYAKDVPVEALFRYLGEKFPCPK